MPNKDYSVKQEQVARFAKAMGHPARIAILQFIAKQWIVDGDNHCILEDFTAPEQNSGYCNVILNFLKTIVDNE